MDLGSKRRDVHPLSTYLMPWLGKPLGSRGVCWSWVLEESNKRGGGKLEGEELSHTGDRRGQGQLPQGFCCRAGDETWGLDLGK